MGAFAECVNPLHIYYNGTEEQWAGVVKEAIDGNNNDRLILHFNS